MSPSAIAYIFISQVVSSPAFVSILTTYVNSSEKHPIMDMNLRLVGDFVSIFMGFGILLCIQAILSPSFPRLCHCCIPFASYLSYAHLLQFMFDLQYSTELLWKPVTWLMFKVSWN